LTLTATPILTNGAQYAAGKCFLSIGLKALGLSSDRYERIPLLAEDSLTTGGAQRGLGLKPIASAESGDGRDHESGGIVAPSAMMSDQNADVYGADRRVVHESVHDPWVSSNRDRDRLLSSDGASSPVDGGLPNAGKKAGIRSGVGGNIDSPLPKALSDALKLMYMELGIDANPIPNPNPNLTLTLYVTLMLTPYPI